MNIVTKIVVKVDGVPKGILSPKEFLILKPYWNSYTTVKFKKEDWLSGIIFVHNYKKYTL